jgi:hypothetical protein
VWNFVTDWHGLAAGGLCHECSSALATIAILDLEIGRPGRSGILLRWCEVDCGILLAIGDGVRHCWSFSCISMNINMYFGGITTTSGNTPINPLPVYASLSAL